MAPRWNQAEEVHDLAFGFGYSIATVGEGSGSLSHLDFPVAVASSGSMLIMLSLSRGVMHSEPAALVSSTLHRILEGENIGQRASTEIEGARARLWRLFEDGKLHGATPKGAILTVSGEGESSIFRFGPVAVATVSDGVVEPLHADDRFPAIKRLGVPLEQILPTADSLDPLVLSVSSLVQLDPEHAGGALHTRVPKNGLLTLMSRAVVPFDLPAPGSSLESWAEADAGWRYGMSGAVVHVFRREEGHAVKPYPWLHHGKTTA